MAHDGPRDGSGNQSGTPHGTPTSGVHRGGRDGAVSTGTHSDRGRHATAQTLSQKVTGLWPVLRQAFGPDHTAHGVAVRSARTDALVARTETADRVVDSICPFCAVGCGQKVYVKDERVIQIEGDPDSPISRGRLCPKGGASKQLVTSDTRVKKVRYRRPGGADWEDLDLDVAMEMIADRVLDARRKGWQDTDEDGNVLRRTMGIASLGGATLDNEENYLMKKLYTALGAVQIENQARI